MYPIITDICITTTSPRHLNYLPNMRQGQTFTDCPAHTLSRFLLSPQSSLPFCFPLGCESMTEVTGETAQWILRDQTKGLPRKFISFKTCFLPASAKLNAHCFSFFFFFNSNVQITVCCKTLESLNLLPPRNKAICW